jgi:hypothetical protein
LAVLQASIMRAQRILVAQVNGVSA